MKFLTLTLTFFLSPVWLFPQTEGWTAPADVKKGKMKVASYRARLAGDVLVIEVTHEAGWHTYALDNLERAKKRAGEPPLGIEKDTQIEIAGDLTVVGPWRQSRPKDLSQREINWYTWGFEGVSLFAAKVKKNGDAKGRVTINAQACKATTCAMIDDLEINLTKSELDAPGEKFDLTQLVEKGDLSDLKQ
jgi:hypothetical protein